MKIRRIKKLKYLTPPFTSMDSRKRILRKLKQLNNLKIKIYQLLISKTSWIQNQLIWMNNFSDTVSRKLKIKRRNTRMRPKLATIMMMNLMLTRIWKFSTRNSIELWTLPQEDSENSDSTDTIRPINCTRETLEPCNTLSLNLQQKRLKNPLKKYRNLFLSKIRSPE